MEKVPFGAKIKLTNYEDKIGVLLAANHEENTYMLVVGDTLERWIMKFCPEEKRLELVLNLNKPREPLEEKIDSKRVRFTEVTEDESGTHAGQEEQPVLSDSKETLPESIRPSE